MSRCFAPACRCVSPCSAWSAEDLDWDADLWDRDTDPVGSWSPSAALDRVCVDTDLDDDDDTEEVVNAAIRQLPAPALVALGEGVLAALAVLDTDWDDDVLLPGEISIAQRDVGWLVRWQDAKGCEHRHRCDTWEQVVELAGLPDDQVGR